MRNLFILLFLTSWLYSQGVEHYSKKFLGSPYGFSPLGEGRGKDSDPRIRTDLFDCTTFVETVLAYSKNSKDPLTILDSIRYKGKPDFYNRRHFPYFWIEELVQNGILKPFKSVYERSITKIINQAVWAKREPKFLKDFDTSKIPNKTYTLSYIPLNKILLLDLKEPVVFSLVRENRETSPIIITHQGFLLPSKNGIIVRHARSKPVSKVIEESLDSFVKRSQSYKNWKVLGLHLNYIIY
ncbi:MAG: DUF1460 domain-containing protein [Campylobacterales bacterium]|nr:DUF1460 domain-containing protein [Campylobacterales bacterium]